ncbi:desulfoferrodoxin [Ruminococcaceae bacterium OttesenSCG-928-N02]|nr:desulfoferrodoxin [Ruminococcaceae bacterium OttesenSCG-928-N02]
MNTLKFYRCEICGNLTYMVQNAGPTPACCGQPMKELIPGVTDASQEKHVPAVQVEGKKVHVQIGSDIHPMLQEHFIQWICLHTTNGARFHMLAPMQEPQASFTLEEGEEVVAVYEYCNLHGLWKKDV